jgi:cell volume regulation protein A
MITDTITAFIAMSSIIFIGFFGSVFFKKFRVPDVLLLVFLGMLIGPDMLGERFHLVTNSTLDSIDHFRDLILSVALVIILFDGGLSLDIRSVFESMRLSAVMSMLTFVLTTVALALSLSLIFGLDLMMALALGSIVGGTSGAIVIPIVNRLTISPKTKSVLVMESAITDVLVVVVAITILSVLAIGSVSFVGVVEDLGLKFLFGALAGFGFGVVWLFILGRLQNQPLSYMLTIGALFLVAGVVEGIGSSGPVAALAFGLSLGNRRFVGRKLTSTYLTRMPESEIQHFHLEVTFIVRTFFFVYLGMLFRFGSFTTVHLVAGLFMISVIILMRWFTSSAVQRVSNLDRKDALALFGLMPRGLAAAVLATVPATMLAGVPLWTEHPDWAPLFLNTTLVVILGTTIVATVVSFMAETGEGRDERRADLAEAEGS